MSSSLRDKYPRVEFSSRQAWRNWLAEHHASSAGVWLVTYKQSSGKAQMTYDDAVEEALCYGWVDSTANTVDEERSMLLYTPRKPKSDWSRPNKRRIERLLANGLMMPAGQTKIDTAKEDGSWALLDAVEDLIVPDDLVAALAVNELARQGFEAFPKSVKKPLLQWVYTAKRAETRRSRIATIVEAAADHRNPLQWAPGEKRK
ncbi:YdeI/OmpD-associated family protein [soil metagenome]